MTSLTEAAAYEALPSLLPSTPRPRPARYGKHWSLVLLLCDLGVALLALAFASAIARQPLALLVETTSASQAAIFGLLIWLALFERIGMYRRSFSAKARDEVYATLAACAIGAAPTVAMYLLLPSLHHFSALLLSAAGLTLAGVVLCRYLVYMLREHVFPPAHRRIAIVGTTQRVNAVARDLSLESADTLVRVELEDFDATIAAVGGDVMRLEWLRLALERQCNEIIVTEAFPPEIMPSVLRITEARGVTLAFAPTRIRPHACQMHVRRDGGLALLFPQSLAICTPRAELLRRAIDLAIAIPAIVVLAPLFVAIAAAVALTSGRPILYGQRRIGKGGGEFEIFKFRTMRVDAESQSGPTWARASELRVTRIGRILRRTSLDELPQLFNVVRGDMAIVGPRPERPFYVEKFRQALARYDERHLVRPGITGWSHVHMRRNVDTSAIGERLSYDLFYLEHWSVFMDFSIICKTAFEFLFHSAV